MVRVAISVYHRIAELLAIKAICLFIVVILSAALTEME
jgi:hypothetical protein